MNTATKLALCCFLVGCSSTSTPTPAPTSDAGQSTTDAGTATPEASTGASCTPVSEPGGSQACTSRGCSGITTSSGGTTRTVCTKTCTPGPGACGAGEVCVNTNLPDDPTPPVYKCLLACSDPRCAAPLQCDTDISACK